MLAFIEGQVIDRFQDQIVLKCSTGLGYRVRYGGPGEMGQHLSLFLTHIQREDQQELFGFLGVHENRFFNLLLKVRGVGPKAAYSLISSLGIENVCQAITLQDKATLKKAPGIGAKAAAQIILDLEEKVGDWQNEGAGFAPRSALTAPTEFGQELLGQSLQACRELGFADEEVLPLARHLLKEQGVARPEQLVELILKEISHGRSRPTL